MKMLPLQDSRWDSQKSRHLVLEEKKEKKSNLKFKQQIYVIYKYPRAILSVIKHCIIERREQMVLTLAGQRGMR